MRPHDTHNIDCTGSDFAGAGSKTSPSARDGGAAPAQVGACLDPPLPAGAGDVDEGAAAETPEDDGDD